MPKEGVIDTYVVEETNEKKEKIITDFISFYTLPSSVLKHETIKEMKAAYLYYYAATKTPLVQLVKAATVLAKKAGHDVFNCLDIMDNKEFLETLKFGPGNGNLMFYLYNYVLPTVKSEELGMVLV
jgi:glycylpeptide N-tetradecanoyltransferase